MSLTESQTATAKMMREQSPPKSWENIAAEMGVSRWSVQYAVQPEYRDYRARLARESRDRVKEGKPVIANIVRSEKRVMSVRHPIVPPPAVYDSLSAQLLGDPPIGRRAIDMRGGPVGAVVHLPNATYGTDGHVAWHLDMRGRLTCETGT